MKCTEGLITWVRPVFLSGSWLEFCEVLIYGAKRSGSAGSPPPGGISGGILTNCDVGGDGGGDLVCIKCGSSSVTMGHPWVEILHARYVKCEACRKVFSILLYEDEDGFTYFTISKGGTSMEIKTRTQKILRHIQRQIRMNSAKQN